ncbi:TroA family protein [Tsukamurella soli]|uniref:Iron-siderophore ABC transporter substrate-binding protein n=1 Tax=Tsukamurella soli TaxID=644556 RepID=A0ABP8J4U8_9ACTN
MGSHTEAARGRLWTATAALATAATVAATVTACGGDAPIERPMSSVVTTTTRIASADIIGLDRDPDAACAAPTHSTAAPARIIVADPDLLDALCALGLQERVVAVAGASPSYLGSKLAAVPQTTGPARPTDLVLGTAGSRAWNTRLGHATVVASPTADWRVSLTAVADAVHLPAQGRAVLTSYDQSVTSTATSIDAAHNTVSLVRFDADSKAYAEGTAPLCAHVLADLGVLRPAAQNTPTPVRLAGDDFSAADGDLIYASYEGTAGQAYGAAVMESKPWLDLRAVSAKRQLLVDDSVWYSAGGPIAAGDVLHDVSESIRSSS